MLKGNLSGFSLGELLQSLAINNHTGTLSITAPDGTKKLLYFSKGDIRLFSHGKPAAPRIGEILVYQGMLNESQLEKALAKQEETGVMLGKILLQEGHVSEDDITQALKGKIQEEIYDLFLWSEGEFEFQVDHCPEDLFDSLQRSVTLAVNPNSVIMEGLRRLDEWGIISSWIQTNDEIFAKTDVEPEGESPYEATVYQLVDGKRSVNDICKEFFGTRFEACRAIYQLLEQDALRPLALEELQELASEALAKSDHVRACVYLKYATQVSPQDAELVVQLGESLAKTYREREAHQTWVTALRIYARRGDWKKAGEVAGHLPANAEMALEDQQTLLQTFLELKDLKRALWAGNLLAVSLQEEGETERAADVLDSLVRLDPSDLNLKIQVATLLQKVGDIDKAIGYYDEVVEDLDRQKKIKDQIKILRIILELDPKRVEIRQRIAMLTALQEKLEKRRKRRVTIAGIVVIFLIMGTVVPCIYILKSRELVAHAQRMEEISLSSKDYGGARAAYEELVKKYPLSWYADQAQEALDRIGRIEQGYLEDTRAREQRSEREKAEALRAQEERLKFLLTRAKELEEKHQMAEARALYKEAQEILDSVRIQKTVLYPVLITSSPAGADVEIDEKHVGKTPVTFRYQRGSEVSIRLSLRGCEGLEQDEVLEEQNTLHFELDRTPSWEYALRSTFRQAMERADELLVFPARNGRVYAFDPANRELAWQRKVGRFGDRISDVHVHGSRVYLTTVVGEVAAMDALSGDPLWITPAVHGPVLAAPATSSDGKIVAVGSLRGDVVALDAQRGRVLARFSTENEILTSPLFVGEVIVASSTDSFVYGYSLEEKRLLFAHELPAAGVTTPVAVDQHVAVATESGHLWVLEQGSWEVQWSARVTDKRIHSILPQGENLLIAIADGRIVTAQLTAKKFSKPWRVAEGSELSGIALTEKKLYATQTNGLVSAWSLDDKKRDWRWQADSSIRIAPSALGKSLFIACDSGTIQVLEILD